MMKKQAPIIFKLTIGVILLFSVIGSGFLFLSEKERQIPRYSIFFDQSLTDEGNPFTKFLYKWESLNPYNNVLEVQYGIDDRLDPSKEFLTLSEIPYLSQQETCPKEISTEWKKGRLSWDSILKDRLPITNEEGSQ
jgi:hypothetical protein